MLRSFPTRVWLFLLAALVFSQVLPAMAAQKTVSVALVLDGPSASGRTFAADLSREIDQVLGSDFQVEFVADASFTADFTREGTDRALDAALADGRIDLVICTGAIGSTAALARVDLAKPTIACFAIGGTPSRFAHLQSRL